MYYGTFKSITRKGQIIGFIACEKSFSLNGIPDSVYRAYKFKRYLNNTVSIIEEAFCTEKEARDFVKPKE